MVSILSQPQSVKSIVGILELDDGIDNTALYVNRPLCVFSHICIYHAVPSIIWYKRHPILKHLCFSSHLAVVFAQSI